MPFNIQKRSGLIVLAVLVALGLWIAHTVRNKAQRAAPPEKEPVSIDFKAIPEIEKILDFGLLQEDEILSSLMDERKKQYGIDDGLDMIAKSNESIRIGDRTVSMGAIIDEARLKKGEVVEKNLGQRTRRNREKTADYGIHVVRTGENIWNIHFALLKNYFANRKINLPALADEPLSNGTSSGVGKILKFSENMVYIYNLKERRLDNDINTIQPLSKIVVYNMSEVFSLLETVDLSNVDRIRFDGDTLWITSE